MLKICVYLNLCLLHISGSALKPNLEISAIGIFKVHFYFYHLILLDTFNKVNPLYNDSVPQNN